MMKEQKGITLVALVITIIVMLILVGVSITVAMNGGLFTKAGDAAVGTKIAQVKEAMALAKSEIIADYYDSTKATGKTVLEGTAVASKVNAYLDGITVTITATTDTTGTTYAITKVEGSLVDADLTTTNFPAAERSFKLDFWKTE